MNSLLGGTTGDLYPSQSLVSGDTAVRSLREKTVLYSPLFSPTSHSWCAVL